MGYGYKTILKVGDEEYDVVAFSYSFEKDINEDGISTSKVKGGYLYLSVSNVPQETVLRWGMERVSFYDGLLEVIDMMDGSTIPEEELYFENATCTSLKIAYTREYTDYMTVFMTISAEDIRIGRETNNKVNRGWTR